MALLCPFVVSTCCWLRNQRLNFFDQGGLERLGVQVARNVEQFTQRLGSNEA
ncbi:hypothetical protein D3C77_725410 [compost metagenome]